MTQSTVVPDLMPHGTADSEISIHVVAPNKRGRIRFPSPSAATPIIRLQMVTFLIVGMNDGDVEVDDCIRMPSHVSFAQRISDLINQIAVVFHVYTQRMPSTVVSYCHGHIFLALTEGMTGSIDSAFQLSRQIVFVQSVWCDDHGVEHDTRLDLYGYIEMGPEA